MRQRIFESGLSGQGAMRKKAGLACRLHRETERAALYEQRSSLFAFRFMLRSAPAGRDEGEAMDVLSFGLADERECPRPIMRQWQAACTLKNTLQKLIAMPI
ncbi:hypothetical protein N0M98_13875 [Paenibacillus doosanensis]|uniref:hypothetical protein n=1 Tax=Paenibacillus doosanensis TaxID=1229154 RepID=UPI00217FFC1E|nr:hypothetical protein [Paenibacillus doosanensis]MCS7461234.1 hypothetical protein [Paenibacillus doosanensis]